MLTTTSELRGKTVLALDAPLGRVEDFLFDDQNWVVRYLVTRTGTWLSNQLILLSPHFIGKLDAEADVIRVRLLKFQIEASPPLAVGLPVSRSYEEEYYRYFGLPAYWEGSALWGRSYSPLDSPGKRDEQDFKLHYHRDTKHLQSSNALCGFQLQTAGASVGRVKGFAISDSAWEVKDLVVRAGYWFASREVLIAPAKIDYIAYEEATVYTSLSKQDIERTAEHGRGEVQGRTSAPEWTQQ